MSEEDAALPPLLAIYLFVDTNLIVNQQPRPLLHRAKVLGLLAYLTLAQAQPILRTTLCELFWPGYPVRSARISLRRTLADLRAYLAPFNPIHSNYQTVQLALDAAPIWCDVLHFEQLLDECQRHPHRTITSCPACQARLHLARSLYKADFLSVLPPVDSPPFNAWVQAQRSHLAARYAELQHDLSHTAPPLGNLPLPQTSLVGRTAELAHLQAYLTHPSTRGLTLVGFGGMGKTRLALALAEQVRDHFPDGVWLVELGALLPTVLPPGALDCLTQEHEWLHDRLATAISLALGFTLQGANRPTAQLTVYLRDKTTLLLLDTFEHLSPAVDLLQTLLQEAPRLRLLITSRHQLDLPACAVYPVEGLSLPPSIPIHALTPQATIAHYSALQLFVERAEAAAFNLTWDEQTLAVISDLCRLVEGAPLAIELAAALLESQSPAQILLAVRANYSALQAELLDLPSRQRSAEAIFLTSWRLLTPHEAQTLACCAVFHGGFTVAAAQAVVAATPVTLAALVQKSLLHPAAADRYVMHDLVRYFVSAQPAYTEARQQSQAAHAAYFCALLAPWQPDHQDDATVDAVIAAARPDWENVQAAWQWAVVTGARPLLQQSNFGLAEYCLTTGLYLVLNHLVGNAVARVRTLAEANLATPDHTAWQTLLAHLIWHQARITHAIFAQLEQAQRLAEELVAWGRHLADPTLEGYGYYELGVVALYQGNYQRQETLLRQALTLAQQQGGRYHQLVCLGLLGASLKGLHQYSAAQRAFQEALPLAQALGTSRMLIWLLNNLGSLHWSAGNFTAAIACFEEVLPRAQRLAQKDSETFAIACIGALAFTLGDYTTAHTHLTTAQQTYQTLGDQTLAAQLLTLLGALAEERGDLAAADAYCQRALAAPAAHLYAVQSAALVLRGHLLRHAGAWAAALAAYQAAHELSQAQQVVTDILAVETYMAALALAQGNAAAARAAIEPVLAQTVNTSFDANQRPQELLWIAYQILHANQDPRSAAVLEQAWTLVQQQLANISDPHLRTTFLTNVAVNRTLAQLVEAGSASV